MYVYHTVNVPVLKDTLKIPSFLLVHYRRAEVGFFCLILWSRDSEIFRDVTSQGQEQKHKIMDYSVKVYHGRLMPSIKFSTITQNFKVFRVCWLGQWLSGKSVAWHVARPKFSFNTTQETKIFLFTVLHTRKNCCSQIQNDFPFWEQRKF